MDHKERALERVFLIGSEQLGRGSEELGRLLMRNYLYTLAEGPGIPETVIFINSAVKLCAEGSPVLEELNRLQDRGVNLLACGTCLDYFDLGNRLSAGRVSNMYEINDVLNKAGRVLTL